MNEGGKMLRLPALSVLVLLLSACVSREAIIAGDELTCTEIGFAPGTPDYRDCVLRLETARLQGHHYRY